MDSFAIIVNIFSQLIVFAKFSILNVCEGSSYAFKADQNQISTFIMILL